MPAAPGADCVLSVGALRRRGKPRPERASRAKNHHPARSPYRRWPVVCSLCGTTGHRRHVAQSDRTQLLRADRGRLQRPLSGWILPRAGSRRRQCNRRFRYRRRASARATSRSIQPKQPLHANCPIGEPDGRQRPAGRAFRHGAKAVRDRRGAGGGRTAPISNSGCDVGRDSIAFGTERAPRSIASRGLHQNRGRRQATARHSRPDSETGRESRRRQVRQSSTFDVRTVECRRNQGATGGRGRLSAGRSSPTCRARPASCRRTAFRDGPSLLPNGRAPR